MTEHDGWPIYDDALALVNDLFGIKFKSTETALITRLVELLYPSVTKRITSVSTVTGRARLHQSDKERGLASQTNMQAQNDEKTWQAIISQVEAVLSKLTDLELNDLRENSLEFIFRAILSNYKTYYNHHSCIDPHHVWAQVECYRYGSSLMESEDTNTFYVTPMNHPWSSRETDQGKPDLLVKMGPAKTKRLYVVELKYLVPNFNKTLLQAVIKDRQGDDNDDNEKEDDDEDNLHLKNILDVEMGKKCSWRSDTVTTLGQLLQSAVSQACQYHGYEYIVGSFDSVHCLAIVAVGRYLVSSDLSKTKVPSPYPVVELRNLSMLSASTTPWNKDQLNHLDILYNKLDKAMKAIKIIKDNSTKDDEHDQKNGKEEEQEEKEKSSPVPATSKKQKKPHKA